MNYYNEFDPKAADWLRELIRQKLIPEGIVDQRSITEINPDELTQYTQCHFFAGIGGWSLAFELAGWPPDRPVWTGSCPCQPFSSAGQGKGGSDDRHLWPVFHRLISKLRPERVFGEQVAQAIGFNWLDGISADLEADGYAVGAAVLGAHSVGAPHIRQRLYWMADADSERYRGQRSAKIGWGEFVSGSATGGMGDAEREGLEGLAGNGGNGNQSRRIDENQAGYATAPSKSLWLADPDDSGLQGRERDRAAGQEKPSVGHATECGRDLPTAWSRFEIVHCRDGKARRFEPESHPLVNGFPARVAVLRGFGNAIVPQVAAEFILASE